MIFQNPAIRKQANQAASGGNLTGFLANHPTAQRAFLSHANSGNAQALGAENQVASRGNLGGPLGNVGAPPPTPAPTGGGATGAAKKPGGTGGGGIGAMANGGNPGTPGGPSSTGMGGLPGGGGGGPSFQSTLDSQFGTGNPYAPGSGSAGSAASSLGGLGNMSTSNQWYGNSPIQTAQDAAQRMLGQNLGNLNARFGAQGGGNSARAALASGNAVGDMSTMLGAQLAQMGIGARQGDIANATNAFAQQGNIGTNQANTALNAQLGAGQQAQNQQALALQGNQQQFNQGQALTGIGASEQGIPDANMLATLLGLMGRTNTQGQTSQAGTSTTGFLGM